MRKTLPTVIQRFIVGRQRKRGRKRNGFALQGKNRSSGCQVWRFINCTRSSPIFHVPAKTPMINVLPRPSRVHATQQYIIVRSRITAVFASSNDLSTCSQLLIDRYRHRGGIAHVRRLYQCPTLIIMRRIFGPSSRKTRRAGPRRGRRGERDVNHQTGWTSIKAPDSRRRNSCRHLRKLTRKGRRNWIGPVPQKKRVCA
jgi:hypothetical protein